MESFSVIRTDQTVNDVEEIIATYCETHIKHIQIHSGRERRGHTRQTCRYAQETLYLRVLTHSLFIQYEYCNPKQLSITLNLITHAVVLIVTN